MASNFARRTGPASLRSTVGMLPRGHVPDGAVSVRRQSADEVERRLQAP
ncbi:hypothetical protein ACN6K9_008216 [Streptomyces sp. SAS_267]